MAWPRSHLWGVQKRVWSGEGGGKKNVARMRGAKKDVEPEG